VQALADEAGSAGIEAPLAAARLTASVDELEAALAGSPAIVAVGPSPRLLLAREALGRLRQAALGALGAYHRSNPLRAAMPREELRARVCPGSRAALFDRVVDELAAGGQVRALAEAVALATHDVRLDSREQQARDTLLAAAASAGLAGVEIAPLAQQRGSDPALLLRVARVLVAEGSLACVRGVTFVNNEAIDTLKTNVRLRWSSGSRLDVGDFKEMTGLTRKHAIPLLEYLDRERVTRRVGANRFVM
jgi:selenocysteine-specific elongation factor